MYWALNCGGVGVGCRDQVVLKDYGADQLGYVLKETIATTDQQRTFTITHQVVGSLPGQRHRLRRGKDIRRQAWRDRNDPAGGKSGTGHRCPYGGRNSATNNYSILRLAAVT